MAQQTQAREPKPRWGQVPEAVRQATARRLGTPVQRATRVWGGYGPSATFRLVLADGRRAFFKGVYPSSNEVMGPALVREARIYRDLGDLIAPWAPDFYGEIKEAGWHALLLEDLGPATVPPWTEAAVRAVVQEYARFHASTWRKPLPDWLPGRERWAPFGTGWEQLQEPVPGPGGTERIGLDHLAALAGERAGEAREWLDEALPALRAAAQSFQQIHRPFALLHLDTRSDNLRLQGQRLRLFDWPFACAGPPELDIVALAQSITVEGGPPPEQVLAYYKGHMATRASTIAYSAAALAGYFAERAWQPEIPGLPRLRSFQRRQLRVTLNMAARFLQLPSPQWLDAIPE